MANNLDDRVFFYLSRNGRSPIEEFLVGCSPSIRHQFAEAVSLLTIGKTLQMPTSRALFSIKKGLHELRLRDGTVPVRVFYFVTNGRKLCFVHAFVKKTQELPKKEIHIVLQRLKEF